MRTYKSFVVVIVEVSSTPQWVQVVQTPREIIAGVAFNGLEKADGQIEVHGEHVVGEQHGSNRRTKAEDDGFDGVSIFSCNTKGCLVLVMHFVNRLVHKSPMQESMDPVEIEIFNEDANNTHAQHIRPTDEWM